MPVLFHLPCSASPFLPVLSCLSCTACPVMSYLSCPAWPVICPLLSVLFFLSYSACPVLPVLFWGPVPFVLLSCPVPFWLSCFGCPVLSVLFWLSCLGCPILLVLFCLSCSLLVPFWLSCSLQSCFGCPVLCCPVLCCPVLVVDPREKAREKRVGGGSGVGNFQMQDGWQRRPKEFTNRWKYGLNLEILTSTSRKCSKNRKRPSTWCFLEHFPLYSSANGCFKGLGHGIRFRFKWYGFIGLGQERVREMSKVL